MLEELKNCKSVNKFAVEYGIAYSTAKRKLETLKTQLREEVKKEIKVEEKSVKNKKEEIEKELVTYNASELRIIPSVILDIDKLISQGTTFYIQESKNEVKKYENMLQDLQHTLENNYDMADEDYITISKNIGIIRRKRRLYKNEVELLELNKIDCNNFINFIKSVKDFSSKVNDRVYKTRVMKEQIGDKLIASENNRMIEEYKEKAKISEDIVKRLIELDKLNIKTVEKL